MSDISANNKKIVRNTVFMYLRMFLIMCVGLYTVRVVFASLGEVDYGINNVVGGVVTMFSFVTATMSAASLRFFAYDIGRNDQESLTRYFSVSFWCYLFLAIGFLLLAETVGLWFVKSKLVIPEERMAAALWVYQCAVFSCIVGMLVIPFNSLILAHERMDLYAYVGIVETVLKLLIAIAIKYDNGDKLILYAVLLAISSTLIALFYVFYDWRHFKESRVKRIWDKMVFRSVLGFSSWSLYGSVSLVMRNQGINILLNIFFGPAVNAARAIAYQVDAAILNFVNGFSQAIRPQITKYYSSGEQNKMLLLAYRSSRLCFYLYYALAIPLLIETETILKLWLGEVPTITIVFTRLILINSIIESLAMPFKSVISATGIIKWNQLINGTIRLLNFPLAWIFLKIGYPPEITLYIAIVSGLVCHIVRLIISKRLTIFNFKDYYRFALNSIIKVAVIIPIIPIVLYYCLNESIINMLLIVFVSLVISLISIWFLGITVDEREKIRLWIKEKVFTRAK